MLNANTRYKLYVSYKLNFFPRAHIMNDIHHMQIAEEIDGFSVDILCVEQLMDDFYSGPMECNDRSVLP